jgi:hypothetical protein
MLASNADHAACRPRPHVREDLLGHPDHAEEVHIEHALGLFEGALLSGTPGADTSVVDEHIDPPELGDDLIDEDRHRLVAGHVEGQERDPVGCRDTGRVPARSDYVEAGVDERGSRSRTDARRCAGHQGHWP